MIFRRYSTFQSKKNPSDLKKHLLGQHLQVHDLDFEIFDRGELIKIIPELNCYETQPLLTTSVWNENGKIIDTDIQNKYELVNDEDTNTNEDTESNGSSQDTDVKNIRVFGSYNHYRPF